MKTSSKPAKFDNIPLKRWLLKVGPTRRRLLLRKFREDLVCLNLPEFAVRKGLLQLSSRPVIALNRESTKVQLQGIRRRRMKGPRSRNHKHNHNQHSSSAKKTEQHCDSDKNNNCASVNVNQSKTGRCNSSKLDPSVIPECSTPAKEVARPGCSKEKAMEKIKEGESGKRSSISGRDKYQKHSSRKRSRSQRRNRELADGENPNGIMWRLIPIDLPQSTKPTASESLKLHLELAEKKRKMERLYAKFVEIFGEDVDPEEPRVESAPSGKSIIPTCNESDTTTTQEETEASEISDRRSPIFTNRFRMKRRGECPVVNGKKSKTVVEPQIHPTADLKAQQVAATSHDASTDKEADRAEVPRGVSSQDQITITASITSVDSCDRENIVNPREAADEELDTSTASSGASTDSNDSERERRISRESANSGLTLESDDSPCNTLNGSASAVETVSAPRKESVIIEPHKNRKKPSAVNSAQTDAAPQLESVLNCTADPALEAGSTNSTVILDDDTLSREIDENNSKSHISDLPETPVSPDDKHLQSELADRLLIKSIPKLVDLIPSNFPDKQQPDISTVLDIADALDNDPSPSSTTGMESSSALGPGIACIGDRLLGALDNIFLALHCRRRVRERQQTASKLAIKQNRQKVILKAQHEFQSELITFKDELLYLSKRLKTWDSVLKFIAQGLDHRTPTGIEPFSEVEVETAMREADVQIPFTMAERESEGSTAIQSVGKIICTIDLTEDNWPDDVIICDSSTDPPRSQNYKNTELDLSVIPSIAEVKTISWQQFEKLEQKPSSPLHSDHPCYLCLRNSSLACGQCCKATYCSKKCQKLHWEQTHYTSCVPMEGVISCSK